MKVVALIPARGGSKGIKYKNIIELAGKPLLVYSIDAAKKSALINEIYVSSDDDKILAVARNNHVSTILRDASLAQDQTPTNPVIEEFIDKAGLSAEDIIVLLQPTSPLRTSRHIDEALQLFTANASSSALISVSKADNKFLYAYVGADPYLHPVAPEYMKISRRQDLPDIYLPNGALYIFTVAAFNHEKKIPKDKLLAYVMSESDSVDIDNYDDLAKAENYLAQKTVSLTDKDEA